MPDNVFVSVSDIVAVEVVFVAVIQGVTVKVTSSVDCEQDPFAAIV